MQLGGGTDINRAVAYCEDRIERPAKAHLILITDLYEGGNAGSAGRPAGAAGRLRGVNVIVLLALTDTGRPGYDPALSAKVAALGIPGLRLHAGPVSRPDGDGAEARGRRRMGGRPGYQADPAGRLKASGLELRLAEDATIQSRKTRRRSVSWRFCG